MTMMERTRARQRWRTVYVDGALGGHAADHVARDTQELSRVVGRHRGYSQQAGPRVDHHPAAAHHRQPVLQSTATQFTGSRSYSITERRVPQLIPVCLAVSLQAT